MNKVLNEIKSIPGVTGGFFFDSITGVKTRDVPPIFKTENLAKIASVLDKMYAVSYTGLKNISDICLYYEESTIIMRRIGKTSSLIILCDPSFNQHLLTMSINMLAGDLDRIGIALEKSENQTETNADNIVHGLAIPGDSAEFAESHENVSEDELINNSPISEQLQGMQNALFEIIGPMAELIFKDAVRDWIKSVEPSETSFHVLVKLLTNEINDPENENKYLELISSYYS